MSGVSLSKYYMKKMLHQNWGRILFISSECAYLVPTDMISYSATKAALHETSRGLAQLAKGTGVTSNVVVPSVESWRHGAAITPLNYLKKQNKKE